MPLKRVLYGTKVKDMLKCKDNECKITVTNDVKSGNNLILTIVQNKCNVKKGEYVNFVGTIDIETSSIELAKLSKDEIEYSNVIKIELDDLINNINLIRSNIFVINGYMVTDGDKYKLFDSKDSYLNNESAGNYFLINWKEKFNYTGNQAVTLQCNLLGSYKLNNCELKK